MNEQSSVTYWLISRQAEIELEDNFQLYEKRKRVKTKLVDITQGTSIGLCLLFFCLGWYAMAIILIPVPVIVFIIEFIADSTIEKAYWATRKQVVIKYLRMWQNSPYYDNEDVGQRGGGIEGWCDLTFGKVLDVRWRNWDEMPKR